MKFKFLIFSFLTAFTLSVFSQNKIVDSLENVLNIKQLTNEEKCEVIHELSLKLVDVDPEKAKEYTVEHLKIAKKNNLPIQIADALNIQGLLARNSGDYENAISLFIKALKTYDELDEKKHIAMTYNNIGVAHMYNEVNSEAKKNYLKALEISSITKDTNVIKMSINNLGILACYEGEFQKGISYFFESYEIEKYLNNKKGISESVNNIGAAYYYLGNVDSAMYYFNEALEAERSLNDIAGIAGSLVNIGQVYSELGQFAEAEKYLIEAEKIALENGIAAEYQDALGNLSLLFEYTGDFKKSLSYQRLFQSVRDSIHNIKKSEQIAEMQTKYETEKKEKKLAEQQIELATNETKIQKRNVQLLSLSGGLIIIVLVGVFIYKTQKDRQDKLQQQVALEQAESLNKVQNEKLRISRDLHDNIGSQLTFVISSLDNMNYIKDEEKRKMKLNELGGFTKDTMNQLRETIWAIKSESITLNELSFKVSEYIDKAKIACSTINFKVESIKSNRILDSNQAINTYRVIQEAVNNAIKYAKATTINIEIIDTKITISDNGIGFDKSEIKKGNGLINMKARMEEVGFRTEVHSRIDDGSRVLIFLSN